MRKIFGSIVIIIIFLAVWVFASRSSSAPTVQKQIEQATKPLSDNNTQSETIETKSSPKKLIIEKLGIAASIESVGMDAKGNMDVPKDEDNVAWYNLGYKPGQKGSAVIAGHFDKRTGAPAVFYNLEKLRPGDTIQVTDDTGEIFAYSVTESATYPFDNFPLQKVFASNDKARLNLITCDGVFDKSSKNYSNRYVVYAELVE